MGNLRQTGALKLRFPKADGPVLQAIGINTAGGVSGGDEFGLEARVEELPFLAWPVGRRLIRGEPSRQERSLLL